MAETEAYIICASNDSMPGILKVFVSEMTPTEAFHEANTADDWRPPTPYKLEFAKKVSNSTNREKNLQAAIETHHGRITPLQSFFKISLEQARVFIDIIDGEVWVETNTKPVLGCRNMSKCFTDKQRIRHKTWVGIYNASKKAIIYNGKSYTSLSAFTKAHYKAERQDRTSESNGWKECECEINGEWHSTYNLPEIN